MPRTHQSPSALAVAPVGGSPFREDLHAKQIESLANAATGALKSCRPRIAAIGRALAIARGLDAKHTIKQVDRLLSNRRSTLGRSFADWVPSASVLGLRSWSPGLDRIRCRWPFHDRPLPRDSSWRATPLMWKTVEKGKLKDSRNAHKDELLLRFEEVLQGPIQGTVLADRGFGDQKLYAL